MSDFVEVPALTIYRQGQQIERLTRELASSEERVKNAMKARQRMEQNAAQDHADWIALRRELVKAREWIKGAPHRTDCPMRFLSHPHQGQQRYCTCGRDAFFAKENEQ